MSTNSLYRMKKYVKHGWNKCDVCGCFIAFHSFGNQASRKLITPSAEGTEETYETLCRKHMEKAGD